ASAATMRGCAWRSRPRPRRLSKPVDPAQRQAHSGRAQCLHNPRTTPKDQAMSQATPNPGRRRILQTIAAAAAACSLPARAAWPDKPIKIVVTFPAGGASDIVARVMAEQLATRLGQGVVVDNRPGAGGSVGGGVVTQAPADGYTLMLSNSTPISIGPFALEKQP